VNDDQSLIARLLHIETDRIRAEHRLSVVTRVDQDNLIDVAFHDSHWVFVEPDLVP
jgi:hypothetical protein